jgi:hypothetical protein
VVEKKIPGIDVQDNKREQALAALLELEVTGKRGGYDAFDELGNPYELKTTSKNDVGTGRDVGRDFVAKLRSEYFIAAKTDPESIEWKPAKIIACHPDDLESWISEKLESRLAKDEKLLDRVLARIKNIFQNDDVERVVYLMSRGMTYNNPKISWDYLERHGTTLDIKNPAKSLKKFVNQRPLPIQN